MGRHAHWRSVGRTGLQPTEALFRQASAIPFSVKTVGTCSIVINNPTNKKLQKFFDKNDESINTIQNIFTYKYSLSFK